MSSDARSFRCSDGLWRSAKTASIKLSAQEGERVTVSDLLRRGLRREIRESGFDYLLASEEEG